VAQANLFIITAWVLDEFAAKMVADAKAKKDVVFEVAEALDDSKLIHLSEDERKHVHPTAPNTRTASTIPTSGWDRRTPSSWSRRSPRSLANSSRS